MSEPAVTDPAVTDRPDAEQQPRRLPLTASQTVGPYLAIGLSWDDGEQVVPAGTPGAVRIAGVVYDGAGEPVPDGLVETWQADPDGRFDHPDDPRGALACAVAGFRGFGRSRTRPDGSWQVVTLRPGALPVPGGGTEAPHLTVSVFARGLLDRVVTRIYFPEDGGHPGAGGHAADPVLAGVDPARRHTLVARAVDGGYRFDIRLQGEDETVFFDL